MVQRSKAAGEKTQLKIFLKEIYFKAKELEDLKIGIKF
jgi:hypothetical protein